MATESSLTAVPEAPTAPMYASSHRMPFLSDSNPNLVEMKLPIPSRYEQMYPTLILDAYHFRSESKPSNVLAFVQNAAKREIADLVTVVLPALQNSFQKPAEGSDVDSMVDFADLQTWWDEFLRFFFFVAETNEDIVRMTTERAAKIARRLGDFKRFSIMQRRRKSLEDRYSFTMEVVFRAANGALAAYMSEPNSERLTRTVKKLEAASQFMLDTMDVSKCMVTELESFCGLELNRLEYAVAERLHSFARSERPLFVCLFVRWLEDEVLIKSWMQKHCGIRGRLYGDVWRKAYTEGRGKFVSDLGVRLSHV